jgi:hypothetical protein
MPKNDHKKPIATKDKDDVPESLLYPAKDDIYNRSEKKPNLDPDDNSVLASNEKEDTMNEKDFTEDLSGSDLDVPGSELDDRNEEIGEEDEENNYYSLGGDNHDNLEESKED